MSAATHPWPPPRRDPLRLLLSPAPWAALAYLGSYLVVGTVLFTQVVIVVVTAASLSFTLTLAGIPLLVAAAVVVRGCAQVERVRSGLVIPGPVQSAYLPVTRPGVMAQLRTRWRDPATRRDLAYVVFMYVPLLLMDTVVFGLWLSFLAGITLPLWYWSTPQTFDNGQVAHGVALGYLPNGPDGPGGFGWWIGSLPSALLAAAVFLVLLLLGNYLVVLAAGVHGRIARALLGPFSDPLADAKQVLASPGPLG